MIVSFPSAAFADAEEMSITADIQAAIDDCGRGANGLAQFVAGEKPIARFGGEDVDIARGADRVDLAVDQERRGVEAGFRNAFEPDALAGADVVTAGEAGVVDEVEVLATCQGAGDIRKVLAVIPDALRR